jgi:hypothetical protein
MTWQLNLVKQSVAQYSQFVFLESILQGAFYNYYIKFSAQTFAVCIFVPIQVKSQ